MSSNFYAYISRMKLINRWGLMRNTSFENDMEHSLQVVMLAHGIGIIANKRCGACVDLGKIALIAAYHDVSEVITGDMATPIKYFSPDIRRAYREIEDAACEKLIAMLPDDMKDDIGKLMNADSNSHEYKIVKAADKLSAYIKCIEELKAGNGEFTSACSTISAQLDAIDLPELHLFMEEFIRGFELTLDELS